MIYITRRERFSAAHRLYNEDWEDQKNEAVYGLCSNPLWHGHNYDMWVTVKGEVDPVLGYLCDLKELSEIIKKNIISKVDHKNLNLEVEFLKGKMVSTENLAIGIWNELLPHIEALGVELHSVKIQETENNFVEYFG
ncbi:MAG: 6-carboxytetrahydropterin synthase [Bacteroidales bacterium]|nr:6-carboxytetrahydropterin synthase [Bacteroidales bacterium]MCF8389726.1 6-carboxytetrahydropterin synthase [Bacteroidales bacterium]